MKQLEEKIKIARLFRFPEHTLAWQYLCGFEYPWQALDGLADFICQLGARLSDEQFTRVGEDVWIAKSAKVAPSACINGPCIIGEESEVRHGAFVRGSALVGSGCVVGNSVELKNCILFDGAQVPHFNYVGDSILGYRAHLGAGAVTSNVKSDKTPVVIRCGRESVQTGRKKLGALIGDCVEVGCNSVLNPGTVVGAGSQIYPLSSVRGYVPENSIYKARDCVIVKR